LSDPDSARECARRNVKRVLIMWSQFYVVLVNFRTYLYALRCSHSIYSYTAYAFERASVFIRRLCFARCYRHGRLQHRAKWITQSD